MAPSKRKGKSSLLASSSPSKPSEIKSESESDLDESIEVEEEEEVVLPVKVNNGSITELKNALDDSTKLHLSKNHKFIEDHAHDDLKLILGWLSSLLAGALSFAGWHYGWEKTRGYTLYVVIVYWIISTIAMVHASFVQKQIIYVGKRASMNDKSTFERITISTESSSYDPIYKLNLEYQIPKKSGMKNYSNQLKAPFQDFFDLDGTLIESIWKTYLDGILKTAVSKAN
ncbi:microsomal signal peptidase 25 kDa subunit-domain-containing protein [Melampsora americana]|nr:microsomal signal peptidase 25 kDa subunit-domain-containing protein [Melampsora americana]